MTHLAEFFLGFFSLAESEGRLLRANVLRLTQTCMLFVLGFLFIGAGLAFLLGALYKYLLLIMPEPAALLLLGVASCLLAACLLWSATKWPKKTRAPAQKQKS